MTEDEILPALTPVFREVFDREDLTPTREMTAKDVEGWDSYRQINIIIAVEEHFGVKFRSREIDRLGNVGDLVRLVAEKVNAASTRA